MAGGGNLVMAQCRMTPTPAPPHKGEGDQWQTPAYPRVVKEAQLLLPPSPKPVVCVGGGAGVGVSHQLKARMCHATRITFLN